MENEYLDKYSTCKWRFTTDCQNRDQMRLKTMSVLPKGGVPKAYTAEDIAHDSEICESCDKYEKR